MYGMPKDVEGQCNAHLYIGDDFGDNKATMRCELIKGHSGNHKEVFRDGKAVIEWEINERIDETSQEKVYNDWERLHDFGFGEIMFKPVNKISESLTDAGFEVRIVDDIIVALDLYNEMYEHKHEKIKVLLVTGGMITIEDWICYIPEGVTDAEIRKLVSGSGI